MHVVEIGCGREPGPFFEGAETHFILDKNKTALDLAAQKGNYTPLATSDGTHLKLPDESVDIVLARNVFGDAHLGMEPASASKKPGSLLSDLLAFVLNKTSVTPEEYYLEPEDICFDTKLKIVSEASRVLIQGGCLIAVEQLTPEVADRFFNEVAGDTDLSVGLRFRAGSIAGCTPPSYAAVHDYGTSHAWIGTKSSRHEVQSQ